MDEAAIMERMQPESHIHNHLLRRLIDGVVLAELIMLGYNLFPPHWEGLGRNALCGLIIGVVFGRCRYWLDRKIDEEDHKPVVL